MSKVTFVYPDFENLGIEYLMAICLKNGHEVDFVYYQAEDDYIGRKIKDVSFQKIAKKIIETQPHIVAFSCVTDNYQYQLSCARVLKKRMPNIITIFGGVHPTAVPRKVLQNAEVDCVGIGEAEESFSDFLKKGGRNNSFILPESPVEGIVFKKEGKFIGEFKEGPLPDLDKLPLPYKTPYFSALKDLSNEYRTMTSRGCPYKCSYCFNSFREKSFVRQRKVSNIIEELIYVKAHYPLKHISFLDDSFTTDMEWIFEFCRSYKKEIGLPFGCTANPEYINREIAERLSLAGCINIQLGIQSFSEELCSKILHRKSNNAKVKQAIRDLKEVGIMVQVDHMLGIPGDTLKQQEENILIYNKCRPDLINTVWLTYYPKTAILKMAKEWNLLTKDDINKIEEGKSLTKKSYLVGGSMNNPERYYAIALLVNYLSILPKWLINFLIYSRLYRAFKIRNYFVSVALPCIIVSIFNYKYFRGRSHIIRFIDKMFLQRLKIVERV